MRVQHIFNELKYFGAEIMYVDAAPFYQPIGGGKFVELRVAAINDERRAA